MNINMDIAKIEFTFAFKYSEENSKKHCYFLFFLVK